MVLMSKLHEELEELKKELEKENLFQKWAQSSLKAQKLEEEMYNLNKILGLKCECYDCKVKGLDDDNPSRRI